MTLPEPIKQRQGFKAVGKDQFEACCPAHEDKTASLSIGLGANGRILLKCHAGCELDSILENMGLDKKDLFTTNGDGSKPTSQFNVIATYDYRTANNELSYQVCRMEPKDFRQRKPDINGNWTWSIKGLKRLPYNLPEISQVEYIFINEGEKDVENLRNIGLTATCNSGGAGKWTAELSQYFKPNQHITILPDNDEPGRDHAELVAKNLHGKVASIKILELEGLPEKGDVSDWLQGRDLEAAAEELSRLSEAAAEWKPVEIAQTDNPTVSGCNIAGEARECVESYAGWFSTQQLYSDLGIFDSKEKTAVRVALHRMTGNLIEVDGDRAGWYRVISDRLTEMDLENISTETMDLQFPMDLHNKVKIMPGTLMVLSGGPDSGKSAYLLDMVQRNIDQWDCNYFNSEMGPEELRMRLDLFGNFPRKHKHFHAFERSSDFQDVVRPGKFVLNLIDYLEVTDEFYKISKFLSSIHKNLNGAVAIVALQTKTGTDLPLGGDRAMERARIVLSLKAGNRSDPNTATILKLKNRTTTHSMRGRTRPYKLIKGSEFRCESPDWM